MAAALVNGRSMMRIQGGEKLHIYSCRLWLALKSLENYKGLNLLLLCSHGTSFTAECSLDSSCFHNYSSEVIAFWSACREDRFGSAHLQAINLTQSGSCCVSIRSVRTCVNLDQLHTAAIVSIEGGQLLLQSRENGFLRERGGNYSRWLDVDSSTNYLQWVPH